MVTTAARSLGVAALCFVATTGCAHPGGEFDADGWVQGQVYRCSARCSPAHFKRTPAPVKVVIYFEGEGRAWGGDVTDEGQFNGWLLPGRYRAVATPATLHGATASIVHFTVEKGTNVPVRVEYHVAG